MTREELHIGSLVVLGPGPAMTVESLDNFNEEVGCVWFDEDNHLQRASFKAAILANVR